MDAKTRQTNGIGAGSKDQCSGFLFSGGRDTGRQDSARALGSLGVLLVALVKEKDSPGLAWLGFPSCV